MRRSLALLLVLAVTSAAPLAQEHNSSGPPDYAHYGHPHRHHAAVFFGRTHADGETEATIGVDYERRVSSFFGFGGLLDHAGGDVDSTVLAAAGFFHFRKRMRILVAPGFERRDGDSEGLLRTGVFVDFRIKRLSISPEFSIDWVDGERNEVWGIGAGWAF